MNKKKTDWYGYFGYAYDSICYSLGRNDPLTISADTLSYDGNTGIANANGNVVITQADKTMTGANDGIIQKLRKQI